MHIFVYWTELWGASVTGWRLAGVLPFVSEAKKLQRLHHIFGKAEHALEPLVKKFGSPEKALEAIQNAAIRR